MLHIKYITQNIRMAIRKAILPIMAMMALPMQGQRIAAYADVIDCGQVMYRQPVTVSFELANKGREPLHIDKIETSCGCTKVDYPAGDIAQDTKFTVKAEYDARQLGHFDKPFFVYSNGSKEPLELTLRGVVVTEVTVFAGSYPYSLGSLKADSTSIEFDDVSQGDRPVAQIHIYNPTKGSVSPVLMHLPPYLKAEVSPSVIASAHAGVARLTLDTKLLRDYGLTQTTVYLGAFPGDKVSEDKAIDVSAVLIPHFDEMTPSQKANAPRLSLSTESLDLGPLSGKSKKRGDIELTNTGRSELEISSLQMFTNGLSVSLNKTHLKPGETARLRITAEARLLKQKGRPRVLMITNDPQRPKVVIDIKVRK